jgi:hypothetical protein
MEFKAGQTYRAFIPFGRELYKVHICYVLNSVYENRKLIVYRVYGRHKQWWHEIMCTAREMEHYIEMAKDE